VAFELLDGQFGLVHGGLFVRDGGVFVGVFFVLFLDATDLDVQLGFLLLV